MGIMEETLLTEPESSDFGVAGRGLVGDPLPSACASVAGACSSGRAGSFDLTLSIV